MNSEDEKRRFIAHPPPLGSKTVSAMIDPESGQFHLTARYLAWVAASAVIIYGGLYLLQRINTSATRSAIGTGVVLVLVFGFTAGLTWSARRPIRLSVGTEVLSVGKDPKTFSFSHAQLGLWATGQKTMGTALHLTSGDGVCVIGGRDHRVGAGTRLDAPRTNHVDVWLWDSDFDALLGIVLEREPLQVRRVASDDPVRCLLFPNVELAAGAHHAFAFGKRARLRKSAGQPQIAMDLGAKQISLVSANDNALIASAALEAVTAVAAVHNCWRKGCYKSYALIVTVPGAEPLTIRCLDAAGLTYNSPRFAWRGKGQPRIAAPANYSVSAADWLTLVDRFGLAEYLEDRSK